MSGKRTLDKEIHKSLVLYHGECALRGHIRLLSYDTVIRLRGFEKSHGLDCSLFVYIYSVSAPDRHPHCV